MTQDSFLDLPSFFLSQEGRVLWWNDACRAFTGQDEEHMKNVPLWEAFHDSPKKLPAEMLLEAWKAGTLPISGSGMADDTAYRSRVISVERPFSCTLWTWSRLAVDEKSGLHGVIQIFAPARLEQAVEDSPLVRLIIDRFPLPVALLKNHRFYLVNRAYMDLVHCDDPAEICGKPGDYFIDEADKPLFNRLNSNNHQQIVSGNTYRWRYRTKDGELRHITGHPSVLSWSDGAILLSTLTDDTDNVLREQSILAEQKELKRARGQIAENDVLHFADVAGPVVAANSFQNVRRNDGVGIQRVELPEKEPGKEYDVFPSFPEGRNVKIDHENAEEEVVAQRTFLHHVYEVAVGGAYETYVGVVHLAAAYGRVGA